MKNKLLKNKLQKNLFFIIMVVVFLLMYILNAKTHFVSDDYVYQFVFTGRVPTDDTKLIGSVVDIFHSMVNHWNLWGGRVFNHALLQFVFMLGKTPFDIVNSFMFVLLGFLIYKHVVVDKSYKPFLLLVIYAVIFILAPQPSCTLLWKSGSANYLWVSNIFLVMSLIYKRYYERTGLKDNIWNIIILFVLGFIVGCGSENASVGMIILLLLYIFVYRRERIKIPKWSIGGVFGCFLGFILLVLAPGNYIRADLMYSKKALSIEAIFGDFLDLTNLSYQYLFIVVISVIISTILIYKRNDNCKLLNNLFKQYGIQSIFGIAAVISIYSLILSPASPERCWFFAFVFLLIPLLINVSMLDWKKEYLYKAVISISAITLFIGIKYYAQAYSDINSSYKLLNEQISDIKSQINDGKKDIVVHSIMSHDGRYNAFTDNGYLTDNKNSWFNLWMAEYFGVDSIVAID